MPVDSHVDVHATPHRDSDAISVSCRSKSVAVPQNVSKVISLALQNLNAITEGDYVVAAKAMALEHLHVIEETAAASLAL